MGEGRNTGKPLIHCITNPILMRDSADVVLALGCSPIMAEHPKEVEEITEHAAALLLNLGTITDSRMMAMEKSLEIAGIKGIPVVLDAVGVACSTMRRTFAKKLLEQGKVYLLKGNPSEILALQEDSYSSAGVDSEKIGEQALKEAMKNLRLAYHCRVLATGKVDLFYGESGFEKNKSGCEQMSTITGTGCLLGVVCATFLGRNLREESVIEACYFFGTCGEKAQTDAGSGTYRQRLLDEVWKHENL